MVRTPWSNNPSTPWGPTFRDPSTPAPEDGTSTIDPLALFYATFFGTPKPKSKTKTATPAPAATPVGTTREEMLLAQFAARDAEYARQRLDNDRSIRARKRQKPNYVERPDPGNSFFPGYVGPPPDAPTFQPWSG